MLHSVQGTPAFMAPEVMQGPNPNPNPSPDPNPNSNPNPNPNQVMQGRAHAGAPSDVWSLGVTLVSLLLP